jgi:hypothetical protein
MTSHERAPTDVFDPSYWLPAEYAIKIARAGRVAVSKKNKIRVEEIARGFSVSEKLPPPDHELPYGASINPTQLPGGSIVKFDRECLTSATHPDERVIAAMISEHTIAETGLVGLTYDRRISNEPEPGRHWVDQYERQQGFGIVLTDNRGKQRVFGIKLTTKRIPVDYRPSKFGLQVDYSRRLEHSFVPLNLPVNAPAKVGVAMQSQENKQHNGEPSQLFVVERINSFGIYYPHDS